MKIISAIIVAVVCVCPAAAQTIRGIVFEQNEHGKKSPLTGASVYFPGTATGTTTGSDGRFTIEKTGDLPDSLVFSFIGYLRDTLAITGHPMKVVLDRSLTLEQVEIQARQPESYISMLEPIKTEILTTAELKKNACCNLSESFESNPTVDASYTDAVTGVRQIQMLGLSGRYVQKLQDVLPAARGLNTVMGFNNIPGPWAQDISVVKGAGSVVNGYESVSGQINVELKKPEQTDNWYLNLYGNGEGRAEINLLHAIPISEKWSTMFLTHGSVLENKNDHNGDNFLDIPRYRRYSLMNRWKYDSGHRVEGMAGVIYHDDDRTGGDIRFDEKTDKLSDRYYGIGIRSRRVEAFSKTSLGFIGHEYKSVGLQLSYSMHDAESYFGQKPYAGEQHTLWANLIYQSVFTDTRNKFRMGASFMYDDIEEQYLEQPFSRLETVPGVFFEYTYDDLKHWTLLLGVRGDYHNEYDLFYSPRIHARYRPGENTTIRLSAGRGYRVANFFVEQMQVLASSRDIVFLDDPGVEHAWNYGMNVSHCIEIAGRLASLSVDFYRTDFTNKLVVDLYADATRAYVFHLEDRSWSNSFQAEISYELTLNLKAKAAFKLQEARSQYLSGERKTPFNPSSRGLVNLAYETPSGTWKFDFTTQWVGPQQLPLYHDQDEIMRESPEYVRLLGQVTLRRGRWDLYIGGENLGDFKQEKAIINPDDPFGEFFDAGIAWGPITGRMFYGGLRYVL